MNNNQKNRVPGPVGLGHAPLQQLTRDPLGLGARTGKLPASSPGPTGVNEAPVKHLSDGAYELLGSSFTYVDGIRIDHGTVKQVAELSDAHRRGVLFLEAAMRRLEAAKKHPDLLVEKFFRVKGTGGPDQGTIATLITKFKKIQSGYASATYEILQDWDTRAKVGTEINCFFRSLRGLAPYDGPAASTSWLNMHLGVGDIKIYWAHFAKDLNLRAKTLVHEQAHSSISASDWAYFKKDSEAFGKLSQKERLDNADSYAVFALQAYQDGPVIKAAGQSKQPIGPSGPVVITPKTSIDQCDSIHSCGNSCVKQKAHAGEHQCVLGHTW